METNSDPDSSILYLNMEAIFEMASLEKTLTSSEIRTAFENN